MKSNLFLHKIQPITLLFTILLMLSLYGDLYFSFAKQGLMALTVLFMAQFLTGTWVRQTIIRSITMMLALSFASLCQLINPSGMILIIFSILIALCSLIFSSVQIECQVFALFLLLTNFMPLDAALQNQMLDVLITTCVMITVSIVITFLTLRQDFIKLIIDYIHFLMALINDFQIEKEKQSLLRTNIPLQQKANWILMPGLSPGLRAGFRFYLLQIEHAFELISYIKRAAVIIENDHELYTLFLSLMSLNHHLLQIINCFFTKNKIQFETSDWEQDLLLFENKLQNKLSLPLDIFYLNPNELTAIALLKACKDLRQTLLQLITALPQQANN